MSKEPYRHSNQLCFKCRQLLDQLCNLSFHLGTFSFQLCILPSHVVSHYSHVFCQSSHVFCHPSSVHVLDVHSICFVLSVCILLFELCFLPLKQSILFTKYYFWGWYGGAMVLGNLPPRASYNLDDSRARAYCASSWCGWELSGHFYSPLSFLSSFSLSLGDSPI